MYPFQFNRSLEHVTYNRNNKKHKENQELETPDYFNMISEEDQLKYRNLQKILVSPENRYARNRRVETLKESLEEIRKFCVKNDENDWKRCLVCGVIWLSKNKFNKTEDADSNNNQNNFIDSIAINIRQLKIILGKSKSTINGAMAKMDFITFQTKGEDQDLLYAAMPYFEGRYFEMRQWTIRKRKSNKNNKEKENKKAEATNQNEISFMSFNDFENDESKFDDIDFTDQDFWFSSFGFNIQSMKDYSAMSVNNTIFHLPAFNQNYENKFNTSIFNSVDSILQVNNLLIAINIFKDNLKGVFKGAKNLIVPAGMFLSYFYQLYTIYITTLMAYMAGLTVPRFYY